MLALRRRAARAHLPGTEDGGIVARPRPTQTPGRAPAPAYARADALAMLGLVVLCLALFGPHILGLSTFVGISDRLHNFVSVRQWQVENLQTIGRIPAGMDTFLLGIPTYGFHWTFMPLDAVGALVALFPAREVYRISGYVAAAHFTLGALAAYLLIRDVVRSPFPAAVGAALYVCTTLPLQWISIHETAFAIFTLQPIGLLLLRKVQAGRVAVCFLGLTAVIVALVGFSLLQAVPYVLILFGLYAGYRLVAEREWRPLAILCAAGLIGILLSAPRLGTAIEDFRELSRSASIQSTCACEVLRWFGEGIFGRYPQEATALGNGQLNLHEGLQVHASTLATAGVIAALLRPRGRAAVMAGIGFLFGLMVLALPVTGGGIPALVLLAAVAGLSFWALARRGIGRRLGMTESAFVRDPDLHFFTLFSLLGFAIVLSDDLRYLVYLAFFRVDFTHARIIATAILPLSVLSAVFVHELFGAPAHAQARTGRRHLLALALGGALAVGGILLLGPLAQTLSERWFGPVGGLETGTSWVISTGEVGRIAVSLAVFMVLLAINWLARHVDVSKSAGRRRLAWRGNGPHPQPLRGAARTSAAPTSLCAGEGSGNPHPALPLRGGGLGGGPGRGVRASLWRLVPAYALGCLMVAQAFGNTYFQFNGEHTRSYPVPVIGNNSFTAPPDVLRVPGPAARQAVRERLETDAYRSITVSAADGYPTYDTQSERGYSAFVALFWQLRLANGYMGLSKQIASLPWPDADKTLRGISFRDQNALPWPLLAALNVKYAVVASPSLMFNVPADPARRGADAGPEDLTILENPLPVVPRAFFAEAAVPRALPAPPPATPFPAPPAAFRATALPEQGIALSWTGEIADATYQIQRRQVAPASEPTSTQIAQTDRGANVFIDQGRTPGATYEYTIRTCDRRGCGDLSAPIPAQAAVTSVPAPRSLAVVYQSPSEALVSWEPADETARSVVEVLAGADAPTGPAVELPAGTRSYVAAGLRPLRDYAIRLRACTADGCSPHTAPKLVSMPSALTADELDGIIPADPTHESVVEGLDGPLVFGSAAGAIHADFREPDRIHIQMEPAEVQRFLVVNELPHPNWHAYANAPSGRTELKVWPTNVVMRGILVPPGATEIELRFEPFMLRWTALLPVLAGLLLGAGGWLALRRLDRMQRAGSY